LGEIETTEAVDALARRQGEESQGAVLEAIVLALRMRHRLTGHGMGPKTTE
jgi:hypothetical protein